MSIIAIGGNAKLDRTSIVSLSSDAGSGQVSVVVSSDKDVHLPESINVSSDKVGGIIEISGSDLKTTGGQPVSLLANGETGGGTVKLTATSKDINLKDFNAQIGVTGSDGNGGTLEVHADNGKILFTDSDISVNGVGSGNGGKITLSAASYRFAAGNKNMLLSADAGESGAGGTISLTSQSNLLIDDTSNNAFSFSAIGSSASNGGNIVIESSNGDVFFNGGIKNQTFPLTEVVTRSAGSVSIKAGHKLIMLTDLEVVDNGSQGKIAITGKDVLINPDVKIKATGSSNNLSISIESTGNAAGDAITFAGNNVLSTLGLFHAGKIDIKSAGGISVGSGSSISVAGTTSGGEISIELAHGTLDTPLILAGNTQNPGTVSFIGSNSTNGLMIDLFNSVHTAGGQINFASEGKISVDNNDMTTGLNGAVSAGGELDLATKQPVNFAKEVSIRTPGQQLSVNKINANEGVELTGSQITITDTVLSQNQTVTLTSPAIINNGLVQGKGITLLPVDDNVLSDITITGGSSTGRFDAGSTGGEVSVNTLSKVNLTGKIMFLGDWEISGSELNVVVNSTISVNEGAQAGAGAGNLTVTNPRITLGSSLHVEKEFMWVDPDKSLVLNRTNSLGASITADTMTVSGEDLKIQQSIAGGRAALESTTRTTITTASSIDVETYDVEGIGNEILTLKSTGNITLNAERITGTSVALVKVAAQNVFLINQSSRDTSVNHTLLEANEGYVLVQSSLGGNILIPSVSMICETPTSESLV